MSCETCSNAVALSESGMCPSCSGFWGRTAARLSKENADLRSELARIRTALDIADARANQWKLACERAEFREHCPGCDGDHLR